ncbi:MAG: HK97 family phage prohead protease [Atopobiaceae bacterium]|nr:HK97 family phage prohead protease [Atopobiaceae bacterium]
MPDIRTKAVDLAADAANVTTSAEGGGSITGYASTWTREPDFYGDVVAKGAFANSIARIEAEGRTLPLLWNHDVGDLKSYIGTVTGLAEDDHGLLFTATFDATPEAQHARELAMDGRLCKFSFAYDVIDQMEVELGDGRRANELRELDVHEVSLVMYPANPDTSVVEVKGAASSTSIMGPSAVENTLTINGGFIDASTITTGSLTVKTGRRNSKADEDELRAVRASLMECVAKVDALIGDEADEDDADGTDEPAEGGEGEATPKGREVEQARLDAYRKALLCAYGKNTNKEGNNA